MFKYSLNSTIVCAGCCLHSKCQPNLTGISDLCRQPVRQWFTQYKSKAHTPFIHSIGLYTCDKS